MRSKLLVDENIPWLLVRFLRSMGLDVVWIPETSYQGISDNEVVDPANRDERVVITRDSDYLKPGLRRRTRHGIIYIGEPIRKGNVRKLAENIVRTLEIIKEKPLLATITFSTIELYSLTP
ncbi:MAG: DUF5615 family PIN-like protein [Desulfurococcales archaeon]|nr:DUF5615 family PIN-like protein [Desulfurococcales archaeon]